MGPILRYLVIALFVVLGTSWLISSYQGCQSKSDSSLIDDLENTADDSDLWEEDLEEGDISEADIDISDDPEDLDAEIERLERDLAGDFGDSKPNPAGAAPLERSKPKVTQVANPTRNSKTNYSPSKGAQFLVVAGSYSKTPNANAMAQRLKSIGYDKAEVVEFDYSKYFSVLAGRFVNESEARSIASELQAEGIEAYVHRKR